MTAPTLPWYYARAGGRRRYNASRRRAAAARRLVVVGLLASGMSQAEAARRVGVHRSSVCRDAAWLGKLVGQVAAMPGAVVRITPRGWSLKYSFAAWRGLLPRGVFSALRVRLAGNGQ